MALELPPKGDLGALTRRSTARAGPVRPSYTQAKAVCQVSGACSLRRRDHRAATVSHAQLLGAFLCTLFVCPALGSPRTQRHRACCILQTYNLAEFPASLLVFPVPMHDLGT